MRAQKIVAACVMILSIGGGQLSSAQSATVSTLSTKTFLQLVTPAQNQTHIPVVINKLKMRLGKTAYMYSGATPAGWDCSGLVVWFYKQFKVTVPHSATALGQIGNRVELPTLGDIVLFAKHGQQGFYHAGIYGGSNTVLNANLLYKTTVRQSLHDFSRDKVVFIRVLALPKGNKIVIKETP